MTDQAPRRGDNHICSHSQPAFLLLITYPVVSAIYCYARHVHVIGKTLHSLVYLLGQFPGGGHDDTINGFFGITAIAQFTQYGKQESRSLTRPRLCHADHVTPLEYHGDGMFLNRRALGKIHIVQGIEHLVA